MVLINLLKIFTKIKMSVTKNSELSNLPGGGNLGPICGTCGSGLSSLPGLVRLLLKICKKEKKHMQLSKKQQTNTSLLIKIQLTVVNVNYFHLC